MTDSIRENVLNALVGILQGIKEVDGYSFTPAVYRAVRELTDPAQPAINVWDQAETTDHRFGSFLQSMTVQVEASDDSNGGNFSVIGNRLIADIKRAIFSADSTMGGLSEFINLEASRIEYPENGTIISITVEIVIGYNEQRGDPTLQQ